jgi:hypothetical protein
MRNIAKLTMLGIIFVFFASSFSTVLNAELIQTQESLLDVFAEDSVKYDLLIITYPGFYNELQPLVKHKLNYNLRTKIITLDEAYAIGFMGYDNPEKIKLCIEQFHRQTGVRYVMLVGDYKKMPVRYVYNDEPSDYYEPRYISELYYADLYNDTGVFQTWDEDGDGIYGEWIANQTSARDRYIDLRPDVCVGRLACRNIFEVKIMVDKIIKYESQTYGSDWFNDFVVISGDTYPDGQYPFNTSGYEGEENTESAIKNMTGFNPVRIWISNGNLTGPADVINVINKGAGLIFFEGHASPFAWGTHKYNSYEIIYGLKNTHMWRLWNFYKLPVVVAAACHNGMFDVTPLNILNPLKGEVMHPGDWAMECWAWKLTSKPFGGSIATISNTGLGMTKEDKKSMEGAGDYIDQQFFYVYGNNESDILGEVWAKTINRYIDAYPVDWDIEDSSEFALDMKYDLKTAQQYTLFGDPSLKIGGYPPLL